MPNVSAFTSGQQANIENIIGTNIVDGTNFVDELFGNNADNIILGLGGRDKLDGRDGNDRLDAGSGGIPNFEEESTGGSGNDVYVATSSQDVVIFETGGNDTLDCSALVDPVFLEIPVGMPIEHIIGGQGDDIFKFVDGAALPSGGTIDGQGGIDLLDYRLYLSPVVIDLSTTSGGLSNIENVTGGRGNDVITGNDVRNVLLGGEGDDQIFGNGGNDYIDGQAGNDIMLDGGADNDEIRGGADNDILAGGLGDDVLIGGIGDDTLDGQGGSDTYRMLIGDGADNISDGVAGDTDVLDLTGVASGLKFDIFASHVAVDFLGSPDSVNVTNNSLEKLLAGNGDDFFYFHGSAVLPASGTIERRQGINTLDYSDYLSGVVVDLSLDLPPQRVSPLTCLTFAMSPAAVSRIRLLVTTSQTYCGVSAVTMSCTAAGATIFWQVAREPSNNSMAARETTRMSSIRF